MNKTQKIQACWGHVNSRSAAKMCGVSVEWAYRIYSQLKTGNYPDYKSYYIKKKDR